MESVLRTSEDLLRFADLNPEIAQYLQAHPSPPQSLDDLTSLRANYEKLNQKFLESFGHDSALGVKIQNHTVTARDDFEIPIRIYQPEVPTEPGPLIVVIHGGAKIMGSLTDEEGHCRVYAKQFNATCINIAYRLAPEHKSPTMVEDCWEVIQWCAKNAKELGADPTKGFIVQGSSSGGSMADIMGHLSRDEKLEPPITGLHEICPSPCAYSALPKKYEDRYLSWNQDMEGGLPRAALLRFAELAGTLESPQDPMVSPMLWPGGHKGLAPVFFQVHGRDYTRDGSLIYEGVLREEGVVTKLKVYPGAPHGFNVPFAETQIGKLHEEDTFDGLRWLLSFTKEL